jgi:hypothetical protein
VIAAMARVLLPLHNTPLKIGQIVSPTRHWCEHKLRELEPIFVYFLKKKLPRDAISEIAHDILISVNMFHDWRRSIKVNLGWRLGCMRSIAHGAPIKFQNNKSHNCNTRKHQWKAKFKTINQIIAKIGNRSENKGSSRQIEWARQSETLIQFETEGKRKVRSDESNNGTNRNEQWKRQFKATHRMIETSESTIGEGTLVQWITPIGLPSSDSRASCCKHCPHFTPDRHGSILQWAWTMDPRTEPQISTRSDLPLTAFHCGTIVTLTLQI